MLIFSRLHTVGILLFLLHTTCSFILLTANVDDIKRLAGKYMPEILAENIANFIMKATQKIITNVPDEQMIDQVSEENDQFNIATENQEAGTQNIRDNLSIGSYEGVGSVVEENSDKIIEDTDKVKMPVNSRYIDSYDAENNGKYINNKKDNTRYDRIKDRKSVQSSHTKAKGVNSVKSIQSNNFNVGLDNQPARQYYAVESNKHGNSKYMQSQPKIKAKPNYQSNVKSTIGFAETIDSYEYENPATRKLKSRINHSRNRKVTTAKRLDVNEIDEPNVSFADEGVLRAVKELTTEKIRSEFDQYVNINYPKPDFIATSGSIALTKMPINNKWINDDDD